MKLIPWNLGLALTFLLVPLVPAWGDEDQEQVDHHHEHGLIEEIVVHGHLLGGGERAQNVTILGEEEVARAARNSIGETLGSTVGVHSSSFGPSVGRLVINGLGETRVLVMENHHGTMDASSTGADHGVGVEPFLADSIEILKGSGALFYGSGAIGGAVDVHTNRVPTTVPEKLVGRALLRGDGASNGLYGGARLDGGAGKFAWHLDAYGNQHHDMSIPGYASVSPFPEEHAMEDHDEEEPAHAEEPIKGRLENSFGEFSGGAVGGAYIFDRGHLGVALVRRDWQYGLVGHDQDLHGHGEEEEGHVEEHEEELEEHHVEEGSPWIDLNQTRVQGEFGLHDPISGIEALEGSFVVSDYEHYELEGNGDIATYFSNDSWQGRLIMEVEERADWNGAFGVQLGQTEQGFSQDKASSNPSESQHLAIFGVAQRGFDFFEIETGARIERFEYEAPDGDAIDFLATSASLGAVFFPTDDWHIRIWSDYAMRAPQGEELFSDNTHLSTQGFERGNRQLDEEEAFNLSFGVEYETGTMHLSANLYRYSFDNFIYQQVEDEVVEGLRLIQWQQSEATLVGGDLGAELEVFSQSRGFEGIISIGYDMVRTDLDDPHEKHLPRSPASRLMLAGELTWRDLWARASYTHVFDQDDIISTETRTSSYDNLDLEVEYSFPVDALDELTLFVAGRNLGDEEQRDHTSFVKDVAPRAGRRVEAGVRVKF